MIVSDTFPPDINGVARTLQTLARGLARRGNRVTVVTTTEGARAENAAHAVDVLGMSAIPIPGYDGIRMALATRSHLVELIRKTGTDAMYVAVESLMGINAVRAAQQCGVPVVSGFHTNFHTYSRDYSLPIMRNAAAWYLKHLHNRTARTLTPSESTAVQLRELGIQNVGVLGRGVDTGLFSAQRRDDNLRRDWGAGDSTPVAVFVGRIAAEKNLPLAVKAFAQIQKAVPAARCVFVGSGPKSESLQIEHPEFIYAGARTGEDLARHYASADIFVFPSLSETFGNVLTEALASGLVTVSFDYAAAQQYIKHGENGYVVPVDDETAYLAAISEALSNWNATALRQKALETARNLSWDAIIAQFEQELSDAGTPAAPSPIHKTQHQLPAASPTTL